MHYPIPCSRQCLFASEYSMVLASYARDCLMNFWHAKKLNLRVPSPPFEGLDPREQLGAPISTMRTETKLIPHVENRSKIVFPYGDLKDAVEVVQATFRNGGQRATFDQLAAWMKHKNVGSGTFRSFKIATARIFGLIDVVKDQVSLTEIGNQIIDPVSETQARARAFLNVPLYRKIFEIYKGRLLPEDPALEQEMESLGVAPKQKSRARQSFQRSAAQAGILNETKDRLVLPGGVSLDSKPSDGGASGKVENPQTFTPSGDLDTMLSMLVESLPPSGSEWSREARDQWMRIFERALDRVYKDKDQ
jgi:hypothetical protein